MRNNGAYGDSDSEYYVKKNNTVIFSQNHKSDGKTYTDTIYVSVEFGDELILTTSTIERVPSLLFEGLFYINKANTILPLLLKWENF